MPFLLLLASLITSVFATEVITLTLPSPSATEVLLIFTDQNFQQNMEKSFIAKSCKMRVSHNGMINIRENHFPKVCRAEIIKFILDNDYKADPYYQVFTK